VWSVNFDPTVETEIRKTRPAVVMSSDSMGRLPLKLVAPITEWKSAFAADVWHVGVDPDATNGLTKSSAVDVLQMRGMDTVRFTKKIGELPADKMEEIVLAIAAVVEHP
jgi:mRNA interferase MazF